MKTTKFLIFSLAILFTFSLQAQKGATNTAPVAIEKAAAPRQEAPTPEQRQAKQQERRDAMIEKLGLTEEQAVAFEAINEKYRVQMQETRAKGGEGRKAMGQQMKAIREAKDAELQTILTAEQFELLVAERQAAKSQRQERAGKGPRGGKQ